MDIVMVAQYLGDLDNLEKTNSRFLYLAKLLQQAGNEVEIITTTFLHGKKAHAERIPEDYCGCKITALYEPGYPKNVCLKRLYSHHILAKNLTTYLKARKKPDVIYCAVPSLDFAEAAAKYAKENNIRFIVDIQDLWPEAFRMVFHVPVLSDLIFAPMERQADRIYASADKIVAVSQTYRDRGLRVNKKDKEGLSVFLGTELAKFDQSKQDNLVCRDDDEFWIGYIGTLGHSYDLKCVIDAIAMMPAEYKVRFVVMGDGPLRQDFEDYAEKKQIVATFTGSLPYPEMVGRLCSCNAVANPIAKGAAQSITNKVGDYAMAGLPVINTQENPEYRAYVDSYQFGFNCENSCPEQMAEAIKRLYEDRELCKKMGASSRRFGEDKFDRAKTYPFITEVVTSSEW